MRNFEHDKLSMYMQVILAMQKHETLWQSIPYIADSVAALNAKIETIGIASGEQTDIITGYAKRKKLERNELEALMLFVAKQIRSYAAMQHNESLYNKMQYTKSGISRSRDKDLVFDADNLHAIATEHIAAITNFGVTPAILTSMQTAITKFTNAVTAPLLKRQAQKEATQIIKRTFAEADQLLKDHLDSQMLTFKSSEFDFYTLYTLCRKITGSPTIKTAMRIKVIDSQTKAPLPKALITIKDHNIKRQTSPLGQIVIRNLKEGEHIVTVNLGGYLKKTPKVTHVTGETTMVVVEMERDGRVDFKT